VGSALDVVCGTRAGTDPSVWGNIGLTDERILNRVQKNLPTEDGEMKKVVAQCPSCGDEMVIMRT